MTNIFDKLEIGRILRFSSVCSVAYRGIEISNTIAGFTNNNIFFSLEK